MPTVNEILFDAQVRHAIDVERYSTGQLRALLTILEQVDKELVRLLRERLPQLPRPLEYSGVYLRQLLIDVRALRDVAIRAMSQTLTPSLQELAQLEGEFANKVIQVAVPFEINMASVRAEVLLKLATEKPFKGRTLKDWFESLRQADQRRIYDTIQMGMVEGRSTDEMVQMIAGTRGARYADGVLALTRYNLETVVRTMVNGVMNSAREETWKENEDIILALRWTSVLDGRTTPVCRARDGDLAPIGNKPIPPGHSALQPPTARPPAHPNCRSIMVALLDASGLFGERPYFLNTATREQLNNQFVRESRRTGLPLQIIRKQWYNQTIGMVPADMTYAQWFAQQPYAFREEVLGPTRAKLYERANLKDLHKFIDDEGNALTIAQLRQRYLN